MIDKIDIILITIGLGIISIKLFPSTIIALLKKRQNNTNKLVLINEISDLEKRKNTLYTENERLLESINKKISETDNLIIILKKYLKSQKFR